MTKDSTIAAENERIIKEWETHCSKQWVGIDPKYSTLPNLVGICRSQSSRIESLEAKLKIAREALEEIDEQSLAESKNETGEPPYYLNRFMNIGAIAKNAIKSLHE